MGWVSGIAVYIVTWWVIIFTTLPFGVEAHDGTIAGADRGAPHVPYLKQKMLVTTMLAGIVWLAIYFVINSDLISFQRIAERLSLQ